MISSEEATNTAIEIAINFYGYKPLEILQMIALLNLSALAAISQGRSFKDVIENGMVE